MNLSRFILAVLLAAAAGENLRGAEDAALSEDIVATMPDDIAEPPQDRRLDSDDFGEDEDLSDDFEEDDEDRLLAEMPEGVSLAEDGERRLDSCFSRGNKKCCRKNGRTVCKRKSGQRSGGQRTTCKRRNGRTVCKTCERRNGRTVCKRTSGRDSGGQRTCTKRTRDGRCKLNARQKRARQRARRRREGRFRNFDSFDDSWDSWD